MSVPSPFVTSPADPHPEAPTGSRGGTPAFSTGLSAVLAGRRKIVGGALLVAFVFAALGFLKPRTYTSTASFVPQQRRAQSGASALAAQFGFSLPGADANGTPAYYADMVRARGVLEPVALMTFSGTPVSVRNTRVQRTLLEEFEITEPDPRLRVVKTIDWLLRAVTVNIATKTGVVQLQVRASSAWFAQAVNDSLLASLNRFNVRSRQSQASEERRFTENRLQEVRDSLRLAEARQQAFLQQNREYRNSPQLTFEFERLSRAVAFQQQVFVSLAQAAEQVRVEELRDTPVLTVLDTPDYPARPDGRGTLRRLLTGFFVGALLSVIAILLGAFKRALIDPSGARAPRPLAVEARRLVLDLLRPWRLLAPARDHWYE